MAIRLRWFFWHTNDKSVTVQIDKGRVTATLFLHPKSGASQIVLFDCQPHRQYNDESNLLKVVMYEQVAFLVALQVSQFRVFTWSFFL